MSEPTKNSKTVSVGCKLPHGLRLRLFKMEPFSEAVIGGGVRESKRAVQVGEQIVLKGYAKPFGSEAVALVVGGYAITPNVDREFIAEWLKQNAESAVVKSGLVFIQDGEQRARDEAKEKSALVNGLEALNPKKLPNVGMGFKVETFTKEEAA